MSVLSVLYFLILQFFEIYFAWMSNLDIAYVCSFIFNLTWFYESYVCFASMVLQGKWHCKLFLGHENIISRQLHIFIFQQLSLLHDYHIVYMQQDSVAQTTLNVWNTLPQRTCSPHPQHRCLLDLWMTSNIQITKDNGAYLEEELFDTIGSGLIKIHFQPDENHGTLYSSNLWKVYVYGRTTCCLFT